VLLNHPKFKETVINSTKKFLSLTPGQPHPAILNLKWSKHFPEESRNAEPKYFTLRKVNSTSTAGKALVEWIREYHINSIG
jgi:hypothetical protein